MEHVATVIPYTAKDGYRWKAACTCGWQSREEYLSEEAAREMAESHAKQA